MSNTGSLFRVWDYGYTQVGVTKYHFQVQDWYDQSNPTISESPEPPEPPELPGTIWFRPELTGTTRNVRTHSFKLGSPFIDITTLFISPCSIHSHWGTSVPSPHSTIYICTSSIDTSVISALFGIDWGELLLLLLILILMYSRPVLLLEPDNTHR